MTRAEQLAERLTERGWTMATMESCTAGGLACRITESPGASNYFVGGVIAYENRVKSEWVGVPERALEAHGAVSAEVAEAMAVGGRVRFRVDLCLSITGIAGPGGGTETKPVGTVFISASTVAKTLAARHVFLGDRAAIRSQAIDATLQLALDLLAEI